MKVVFVKTNENMSDDFTKNVSGEIYDSHQEEMVMEKEQMFPNEGRVSGKTSTDAGD